MTFRESTPQSSETSEHGPHPPSEHTRAHETPVCAQASLDQVPTPLLVRVQQLFGFPRDRRCLNGREFLAHWLRVATLERIRLAPREDPQTVVVLKVQSIRTLCTSPSYAWPWCYDTTTKYLSVLQAASLLFKVKQPRGMGACYYFPLTSTPCLPMRAEQVRRLVGRRKGVSHSRALQRVSASMEAAFRASYGKEGMDVQSHVSPSLHLAPPPSQGANTQECPSLTEQSHGEPARREDQVRQTVERLASVFQSYGMRITPAVRASITTIIWEEFAYPATPLPTHASDERMQVSSSPSAQMNSLNDMLLKERATLAQKEHSSWKKSTIGEETSPQHAPSTCVEKGQLVENRSRVASNTRPLGQDQVDLGDQQSQTHTHTRAHARTHFTSLINSQLSKKEIHDRSEKEVSEPGLTKKRVDGSHQAQTREEPGQSSPPCPDSVIVDDHALLPFAQEKDWDSASSDEAGVFLLSLRDQVSAMKVAYETGTHEQFEALALDYSQRFSQSNEKVGVYLKRMYEHPEWLHVAAVDALVRTWFPDPGCRPARLGGGWVIKRYYAYVQGQEEPPAEFVAWAQWILDGGLSYDHLEWVLEAVARKGSGMPGEGKRPLPHEVIIETGWLQEFWAAGGAQGLERYGYLFVDLDGEFFTPQDYERHRQAVVNEVLSTPYDPSDAEVRYEIQTYLAWAESQRLPVEEEQALLTNLPRPLVQWVSALGKRIDTECYSIGVRLAPRSRRRVIEIIERSNPERVWHLANQQQILAWLEWYAYLASVVPEQQVDEEVYPLERE
ncbi:hypothetical protein [Ktedonobacter racemifer]|nr:hypothetical protein [Ktedonobacter racemifer]